MRFLSSDISRRANSWVGLSFPILLCVTACPLFAVRVFLSVTFWMTLRGMAWEAIIERWHGSISKDAIAEAVRLAREALVNHADELVADTAR